MSRRSMHTLLALALAVIALRPAIAEDHEFADLVRRPISHVPSIEDQVRARFDAERIKVDNVQLQRSAVRKFWSIVTPGQQYNVSFRALDSDFECVVFVNDGEGMLNRWISIGDCTRDGEKYRNEDGGKSLLTDEQISFSSRMELPPGWTDDQAEEMGQWCLRYFAPILPYGSHRACECIVKEILPGTTYANLSRYFDEKKAKSLPPLEYMDAVHTCISVTDVQKQPRLPEDPSELLGGKKSEPPKGAPTSIDDLVRRYHDDIPRTEPKPTSPKRPEDPVEALVRRAHGRGESPAKPKVKNAPVDPIETLVRRYHGKDSKIRLPSHRPEDYEERSRSRYESLFERSREEAEQEEVERLRSEREQERLDSLPPGAAP